MKLTVIGIGYMRLVTGTCFAIWETRSICGYHSRKDRGA